MKNVLRGISVGFIGLVGVISPASAQGLEGVGTLDDVGDLEGIELAVSRSFSMDFANLDPTKLIDESGNISFGSDPVLFTITAMEFDEDDNAEQAIESASELANENDMESQGFTFEIFDVDDLGDSSFAYEGVGPDEGFGATYATGLLVQDGEYVYFIVSVGFGEDYDGQGFTVELAEQLMDAEAGDEDAVEFSEDGTSTGGLWDKMPLAEDYEDLLVTDANVYPESDSTATTDEDEEEEEAA